MSIFYHHRLPCFWILGTTLFGLLTAWITVVLWRKYRPKNPAGYPQARLSPADMITLARALLVASVAGFLFLPQPIGFSRWVPGVLYLCAVVSDCADGYMARRNNAASAFGAALDRNVDALTTLVGSILGVAWGLLPPWYVIVGLAFYIFSWSLWLRKKMKLAVGQLAASTYRRIAGASNTLFIGCSLLPLAPPRVVNIIAPIPALLILLSFWKDWKYVISSEK